MQLSRLIAEKTQELTSRDLRGYFRPHLFNSNTSIDLIQSGPLQVWAADQSLKLKNRSLFLSGGVHFSVTPY